MARIAVIGSGFSGISAAAYLGAAGHEVQVYEKNATPGGRARQLHTHNGYTFDMGPSWYWMPDVFEKFFGDFGFKVKDLYDLQLLDPSFDVVFGRNDKVSVPENYGELKRLFERIEPGSGVQLDRFMEEARYKYEQGMQKLVYMPGLSLNEFIDIDLVKGALRLQVFSSFSKHVRKFFKHPKLIALMEFPVLFLGAMPQDTPALYSLMNYAGLKLGTWYPQGGFGSVIQAMVKVAEKQGVRFHFQAPVEKIAIAEKEVKGLMFSDGQFQEFDAVVGAADYQHIEERLLPPDFRNYQEAYWQKKTFAPSCLIYYLGFSEKIPELEHHTLFFDEDLYEHSVEIYKDPKWPEKPLFYACCPSRTDAMVAPEGHENLFLLMPLAPGLEDAEEIREKFFGVMMDRLENQIGRKIRRYIDYKQSYCVSDFVADYNSYNGNAYGLANTLQQTAILKPKIRNKKLSNLFYAGQLTVPGPGVPPSLISGKIAAEQVVKELKKKKHEVNL
ncbi:phytoene desaturase [Salinimicrobium catena]|uniref:Phytoene desaturase n=1 Tax=Salinimicrobium catena TaxID=390640 RepID=A0A1H5P2D2_9FLAO|nr:phytoene desaturase family protein [Salinimicrobium catena]SDL69230.1 phytoene desaturase [Salinimicrobium catena]SEF07764.1 phytoene desaturase [Salinimicrobium catena]